MNDDIVFWLCMEFLNKRRQWAFENISKYKERKESTHFSKVIQDKLDEAILRNSHTVEAYDMCIDIVHRKLVDLKCSLGSSIWIDISSTRALLEDTESPVHKVSLMGIFPIRIDIE